MEGSSREEDIQLEDLLAFYPPVSKPRIQTDITAKKEFNELASDPGERLRKARGDFFKHQKFVQRFLQHYDQLLLFHETGTGKSCAMTAVAEMTRRLHSIGESNIDHIYFIVNNETLEKRLQKEIVCKCTDGVYDIVRSGRDMTREVNANVKKWYTITEREKFAGVLAELTNAQIIDRYSNKIFFIDEAHNLIFEPFKGERSEGSGSIREDKLKQFQLSSLKRLAKESKISIPTKKKDIIAVLLKSVLLTIEKIDESLEDESYRKVKTKHKIKPEFIKEDKYIQYWRLFHLIRNSKTVLATATPMLNESNEIRDLINLILPSTISPSSDLFPDKSDFQSGRVNIQSISKLLAIPPEEKLADWSDVELEKIFRGRVSYVKRLDTGITIEYVGIPISEISNYPHQTDYDTETRVYAEKMGDFQAKVYLEASKSKEGLRTKEKWASDFVYPDGSYGTKGTGKYLSKRANRFTVKISKSKGGRFDEGVQFKKDLSRPLSDPQGIFKYSIKFANAINLINSVRGNVFVYSNLVESGGTVPFSVCLGNQGFELFNETNSVFRLARTALPTYCKSGQSDKTIRKGINPALRYFYLNRDTKAEELDVALELMNSYENRHGEYIKIFMTSPLGGEGISLNNVIQIHLLDGDWKHATNYQAESRAIRATSHDALIAESVGDVVVKIYNHASYACKGGDEEGSSKGKEKIEELDTPGDLCNSDSKLLSVDIRMYELSEQKDREIKRMERLLKRTAVDCQIHFGRNTRMGSPKIEGKDGTAECDYDKCVYECWDPFPTKTDYSTYDVYYIDEPIEAVIRILREYFKSHFSVTLQDVVELIKNDVYPYLFINIPPQIKYVQYAIDRILDNRIQFLNRYGQISYLQKDGDVLFLTLDYPIRDVEDKQNIESDVVNYTADLIGIAENSLEDVVSAQLTEQYERKEEELELYNVDTPEFEKKFYSISIGVLAERFLEDAIIRKIERNEDSLSKKVMKRTSPNLDIIEIDGYGTIYPYVGSWYRIPEPTWFLNRVQKRLDKISGKIGNTAGRKPKGEERIPNPIKYDPSETHNFKIDKSIGPEKYNWGPFLKRPENVYFHTLYSLEPSDSLYDYVPKFNNVSGKIRLYKPSEGKWRDASPVEQVVYSLWAQKALYEFKEAYESEAIYGFFVSGLEPEFRLVPKYQEREMEIEKAKGTKIKGKKIRKNRGIFTGRRCGDYSVSELLRIVALMGTNPPRSEARSSLAQRAPGRSRHLEPQDVDLSREEMLSQIQKSGKRKAIKGGESDELLESIWRWLLYLKGISKEKNALCSVIRDTLRAEGLIFQTY